MRSAARATAHSERTRQSSRAAPDTWAVDCNPFSEVAAPVTLATDSGRIAATGKMATLCFLPHSSTNEIAESVGSEKLCESSQGALPKEAFCSRSKASSP
jgi:hypothetical protein